MAWCFRKGMNVNQPWHPSKVVPMLATRPAIGKPLNDWRGEWICGNEFLAPSVVGRHRQASYRPICAAAVSSREPEVVGRTSDRARR
jgi:hypothetical protein